MRSRVAALVTAALSSTAAYALGAQQHIYQTPTYAQVDRLIAVVRQEEPRPPSGPQLYARPTYDQVEELIRAVKEGGGGSATGGVSVAAFSRATNDIWVAYAAGTNGFGLATNDIWTAISSATNDIVAATNGLWVAARAGFVSPNDFATATNALAEAVDDLCRRASALSSAKRDKGDLAVYRKVKDIWTWTPYAAEQWSTAEAPADFLAAANSPGAMPLAFRGGSGAHGGWFGANQYWPNGNLRYDQGYDFSGDLGELSTNLYFQFTALAEDGKTELFRFGARAHRESATDETLVSWDGSTTEARVAVNQYVRIATTDMVSSGLSGKAGTNELAAAADELRGEIAGLDARIEELSDDKQKYLRVIDFCDAFDADADWYADWADEHGYCTSMRYGNVYVRNYDWKYTEAMTYVGRLPSAEGRYASVFVCNVGTNLTPEVEATGEWTRFHRALPGRAVDGINEKGVVCSINVVPTNGSPWEVSGGARDLSLTRACRYVLDHFDNAADAAAHVAAHGYVPESLTGQGFSLHMMIADARDTYIVEDGMTHRTGPTESVTPMTNFRVVNTSVADPYGSGQVRYGVMKRAATAADPEKEIASAIQSVWYTHAYVKNDDGDYPWPDEFAGTVVVTNADGHVVGTVPEETGSPWEHKLRNDEGDLLQETCKFVIPDVPHERWPRNGLSWQTIHCSVYDMSNRCLRVAVQETPVWTVVSVPSSGGVQPEAVREIVEPMIGAATNELRAEIPGLAGYHPVDTVGRLAMSSGEAIVALGGTTEAQTNGWWLDIVNATPEMRIGTYVIPMGGNWGHISSDTLAVYDDHVTDFSANGGDFARYSLNFERELTTLDYLGDSTSFSYTKGGCYSWDGRTAYVSPGRQLTSAEPFGSGLGASVGLSVLKGFGCAISRDGLWFVSSAGEDSATINFYSLSVPNDATTASIVGTLDTGINLGLDRFYVHSFAISRDGKKMILVNKTSTLALVSMTAAWDPSTASLEGVKYFGNNNWTSVAFDERGLLLLGANGNSSAAIHVFYTSRDPGPSYHTATNGIAITAKMADLPIAGRVALGIDGEALTNAVVGLIEPATNALVVALDHQTSLWSDSNPKSAGCTNRMDSFGNLYKGDVMFGGAFLYNGKLFAYKERYYDEFQNCYEYTNADWQIRYRQRDGRVEWRSGGVGYWHYLYDTTKNLDPTQILNDIGPIEPREDITFYPQGSPAFQPTPYDRFARKSEVPVVIDSTSSTSTVAALSANMGRELQEQIQNLKQRGRYLSIWNAATGLAQTTPTVDPYEYKAGDYFIVGVTAESGGTNYRPSGTNYSASVPSVEVETAAVMPNDTYYYDGAAWSLLHTQQSSVSFGSIAGSPADNAALAYALAAKADALDESQTNAVNSGVTAGKVGAWDDHVSDTNNPHGVTAEQVGALRKTGDTMTGQLRVLSPEWETSLGDEGDGFLLLTMRSLRGNYSATRFFPHGVRSSFGTAYLPKGTGTLVISDEIPRDVPYLDYGDDPPPQPEISLTRASDIYAAATNAAVRASRVEMDALGEELRAEIAAHSPGDYAAVSNAAMTAHRDATNYTDEAIASAIDHASPAFSNAVLAVGLGIDTNSVAQLNEIAATFGDFPLGPGETATTVGGLLAALAAAVAWLRKNKQSQLVVSHPDGTTTAIGSEVDREPTEGSDAVVASGGVLLAIRRMSMIYDPETDEYYQMIEK